MGEILEQIANRLLEERGLDGLVDEANISVSTELVRYTSLYEKLGSISACRSKVEEFIQQTAECPKVQAAMTKIADVFFDAIKETFNQN